MTAIIQLPTKLCQLREADRLVKEWGQIQANKTGGEKVVALEAWRAEMKHYLTSINNPIADR